MTLGDYLNQLEEEGELSILVKAGVVGFKYVMMRDFWNSYQVISRENDFSECTNLLCKRFDISRRTYYYWLSVLQQNL